MTDKEKSEQRFCISGVTCSADFMAARDKVLRHAEELLREKKNKTKES